ncbi:hypothetical protein MYSTI_05317 [Myxococcus stipitatus DSM 14675]|uniref:Lipoprotein n=1 Tax=Myxococcus stipitatus (strain DSM 14675 / JCM 12634 / Mx s8) TaxID=1278073 RepID=L7UG88_MYXSD|nr:hypothetical protein [Myxococcus stipitatus]AGC46597.1 hypothetical protein MYSTI_05317 [Myxococcus stipitatus DSM 14675]
MKKILMYLAAVFAFSVAVPAFAADPPDKCIPPKGAPSLCVRFSNPVGGVDAPAVSCQTDPTKKKNYPFKIFAPPNATGPVDYTPASLHIACHNACIEQYRLCVKKPGTEESDCQSQKLECKVVNSEGKLKALNKSCSVSGGPPPKPHSCSPRRSPSPYVPPPGQEPTDKGYE